MLSDRCVVCLSVMLVYRVLYSQTVEWIRMPLGTEVSLGPGDIVLDGDPLPHGKGHNRPPLFGPFCSGTVALSSC